MTMMAQEFQLYHIPSQLHCQMLTQLVALTASHALQGSPMAHVKVLAFRTRGEGATTILIVGVARLGPQRMPLWFRETSSEHQPSSRAAYTGSCVATKGDKVCSLCSKGLNGTVERYVVVV